VPDASLYRSPFEGLALGPHPASATQCGLRLRASLLPQVVQVSTWPAGAAELFAALDQTLGQPVPRQTGQTLQTRLGLLIRTGPEESLLIGSEGTSLAQELRAAIDAHTGSVTDLSHARVRVSVEGNATLQVFSKLFALDLRPSAFPVHEVRLSGHHHLPALLHRRGALDFDLYLFTSYAHDQLDTLIDAGLEYGVDLQAIR
jgi:methylglutamate dehydrogenase subunit D